MKQITAPYGFVPLSKQVVQPDWLQMRGGHLPPVHDVPFKDGICGSLELEIEAETPIFTRGSRDLALPFQLDDDSYALPATTIRGAIRNTIEIATFSHFSRVNDHRYTIRDLHNPKQYGRFMSDFLRNANTGQKEPMPLVNAGWLTGSCDDQDTWTDLWIEVADFAKIEYQETERAAQRVGVNRYEPNRKQTAADKYETWKHKNLNIPVDAKWHRPSDAGESRLISRYGTATLADAGTSGRLVFTGQPQNRRPGDKRKKHHDFVFISPPAARRLPVSQEVFEAFQFGHSNRGQQNRLGTSLEPNVEWAMWKPRLMNGQAVPVFFLLDKEGAVKAFGLAMMFRMPYLHSIGEAIDNFTSLHRSTEVRFDLAEGLFGTVRELGKRDESGRSIALKGRVGISHARSTTNVIPEDPVQVILGGPKASYYPNYVEQDLTRPGGQPVNKNSYRTWNDADGVPRGWKRYKVLTRTRKPEPPTGEGGKRHDASRVGTTLRPLPAGTKFRAHVDVHNLCPIELGALIWAIDFGQNETARHTIGMARPLGYGRIRISIVHSDVFDMQGARAKLDDCRNSFETYMESCVPGWTHSPQIEELRALAQPVEPTSAEYQRLDPGGFRNDFSDAKIEGLALPSAFNHKSSGPSQQNGQRAPVHSTQRPPHTPIPKPAPPINPRATPQPIAGGKPWRTKERGDVIEVTLTEQNRKGKWRCTVNGYAGTQGTLGGKVPDDAAPGKTVRAVVVVGNDPKNLELQWPE